MSKGQPKLMSTANELAGTGTLPPCLAQQFLFIYLFILLDEETSHKHRENQAWHFLWVMCAISARVTGSHGLAHPSLLHPSPAPLWGGDGSPALCRGTFPRYWGPCTNTSCPVPRPSQAPRWGHPSLTARTGMRMGTGRVSTLPPRHCCPLLSLQENPSAWKVPLPCQHTAGQPCRGG